MLMQKYKLHYNSEFKIDLKCQFTLIKLKPLEASDHFLVIFTPHSFTVKQYI